MYIEQSTSIELDTDYCVAGDLRPCSVRFFNPLLTNKEMQLIVTKYGTDVLAVLDVPNDADTELLVQMIQAELGIPIQEQRLEMDDSPLRGGSLMAQGVVDGSSIVVKQQQAPAAGVGSPQPAAPSSHSQQLVDPASVPPEHLLDLIRQHPNMLVQYRRLDAELGACLEQNDVGKLRVFIMKRAMSRHKVVYEARQEELALATADPMDPEVQRKIAEKIRMQNVEENLNSAMENLPESFARVTMLYVHLQINGKPVKAFVDSGAQITIMSQRCAEACGIMHLVDTRMTTQLRGVGTSQSLGRIHAAQMKFGNTFMALSITVVPNNDMDFLFGLDNLRRLRGVIDLSRNVLCLDGASGREEVEFLGESELPDHAKGTYTGDGSDGGGDDAPGQKEGGQPAPTGMDTSG